MNEPYDIERDLTRWMDAVVPRQAPDNVAPLIVARTRSIRPRPWWLARLMEPPMQTQLSLRRYLGFDRSPRLVLMALLIIALVVGGIVVGSQLVRQRTLPAPFGLADNGLLAAGIGGTIVVTSPDGSDLRPLDLAFSGITGVAFSRDGTRLAAWATADPLGARRSLVIANADGSGAFEVDSTNLVSEPGYRIAWSPDDRRVAFSDAGNRLFVADIDARTIGEIGLNEAIAFRSDPAWAPDGRLAFQCTSTVGPPHLCVMSADFETEQILETSPGTEYAFQAPSWSHDGRSLTYQVDDAIDPQPDGGLGWDVATIELSTGVERILTRGFAPHTILPVWSADDRHIHFTTGDGPGFVRADGTGLNVFAGPCDWNEPSPDAAYVACLRSDQVFLYPMAGGQPTVIELGGPAEFLAWQRQ